MIALAWRTLRGRSTSLAGAFIALALGVALLAAMTLTLVSTVGAAGGPRWYARAGVVVAGADTVSVTTGSGDGTDTNTVGTGQARAVPPGLVAPLAAVAGRAVADYAGYAALAGAPGDTLHPWAAAALHPYVWVSGGPPQGVGQITLTAPTRYRPGDRIIVQTAGGPRRFNVSGVIRTSAQAAFYATGEVAARLAGGRIAAIALIVRPGQPVGVLAAEAQTAAHSQPVQVLTGDQRRLAEPDPEAVLFDAAVSLLGTTSGLAGFVAIFVVASTFAFAVAIRRREFGLLRTVGATPRQVRRLVLGEALVLGAAASVAGGALGSAIAPPFARWLARAGLAPTSFTAHFILWPVAAAAGAGLLIALAGAWLAARRAGRVRPAEALREAGTDRRAMTPARWIIGLAALGGSVPLMQVLTTAHSADTIAVVLPIAVLLITGGVMLAPALIPPLAWLLTGPLTVAAGPAGLLAAHNARTAVRRTAATVAPILITIGIAGATVAGTGTLNATTQQAAASRITAPVMVIPAHGGGLSNATVAAIRAVPGVAAAVPATDTSVYVSSAGDPEQWSGRYLPGPQVGQVLRLPVAAGSLTGLTGTGTVAVPAGSWRLGQIARIWLDDSAPVRLRVVAVLADQVDLDQTVLLPWALRGAHTSTPLASAVYLRLSSGARLPAVRAAAAAGGGTVIRTVGYLSASDAQNNRLNQMVLLAILGLALAYTAIAIANTLVMATGSRTRELATLRLSGATPGQVLTMIGTEACLVAGIGALLATGITAVTVAAVHTGLAGLAPTVRLVIPWPLITGIALACLATALLASLIPAAIGLRHHPAELAPVPE
jgi:putative ABC transport system permease protein